MDTSAPCQASALRPRLRFLFSAQRLVQHQRLVRFIHFFTCQSSTHRRAQRQYIQLLYIALSPSTSFYCSLSHSFIFHFLFIHRPIHSFTYPSLYSIHFFLLQLLYPNSFLLELFPTLTPSRSRLQQLLPTPTPFYGSSLLPRRLSRSLARNQFWQKFRPSPGVVAALCSQPEEARRGPASRGPASRGPTSRGRRK